MLRDEDQAAACLPRSISDGGAKRPDALADGDGHPLAIFDLDLDSIDIDGEAFLFRLGLCGRQSGFGGGLVLVKAGVSQPFDPACIVVVEHDGTVAQPVAVMARKFMAILFNVSHPNRQNEIYGRC